MPSHPVIQNYKGMDYSHHKGLAYHFSGPTRAEMDRVDELHESSSRVRQRNGDVNNRNELSTPKPKRNTNRVTINLPDSTPESHDEDICAHP